MDVAIVVGAGVYVCVVVGAGVYVCVVVGVQAACVFAMAVWIACGDGAQAEKNIRSRTHAFFIFPS